MDPICLVSRFGLSFDADYMLGKPASNFGNQA